MTTIPLRETAHEMIQLWQEERDQFAALISTIEHGLRERATKDFINFREWRLAQVAYGLTEDDNTISYYREQLKQTPA